VEISLKTLRLALLRIYAGSGLKTAQPLSPAELGAAWKQTGLRGSDLERALQILLVRSELSGSEAAGYALTEQGCACLDRLDVDMQQGSLVDEAALLEARYRKSQPSTSFDKRREDKKS
jgi:hypothetical protein